MKVTLTPASIVMALHNVRVQSDSTESLAVDMKAIAERAASAFPSMSFHNALIADNSRTLLEDRYSYIGYSQIDATSFDFWMMSRSGELDPTDEIGQDACDNWCDNAQDVFYGLFELETA